MSDDSGLNFGLRRMAAGIIRTRYQASRPTHEVRGHTPHTCDAVHICELGPFPRRFQLGRVDPPGNATPAG